MSKAHRATVQKQFTNTVDAFSKFAIRDTAAVLVEKMHFIRPQAADLLLDVACGPGVLVLELAGHVRCARGIDVTEAMLRRAREFQLERAIPNAAFDCGEAEHLPYPNATFDLVTCQCAIHHMARPEPVLKEMARVMKPEARLAIVDTLAPESDAKFELFNRIESLRDPSHTHAVRWTRFRALFDENHLKLVDEKIRRRERSFDDWMLRAGLDPADHAYRETRRLLEESIPVDRSGLSPRRANDDLVIVHNEGMFLLAADSSQVK